jgi:hypothetical protein
MSELFPSFSRPRAGAKPVHEQAEARQANNYRQPETRIAQILHHSCFESAIRNPKSATRNDIMSA